MVSAELSEFIFFSLQRNKNIKKHEKHIKWRMCLLIQQKIKTLRQELLRPNTVRFTLLNVLNQRD